MIIIPFLDMWEDAMVTGAKTCTTRSKKYGEVGDRFEAFGREFELVSVTRNTLGYVAAELWREEGCFSPTEFKDIYRKIHPRRRFQPHELKWIHSFVRVR